MRADEIQVGKTYEGRTGSRLKVLRIMPEHLGNGLLIRYHNGKNSHAMYATNFAGWAVREVTDAN